jgi:predicted dinucleotide-binding enzyme
MSQGQLHAPPPAVDAGKLTQARLLEPWALLWISLALKGPAGRDFGSALLRRQPS